MDQRLNDAAQAGDIEGLYALIQQDPFVLENIDKVPFSHTPLHAAVLAQQTHFAKEVASLKPSFAGKLNQDGLSPIHLATRTGQTGMVQALLTINPQLCLLKGKEKRIPLHCAATFGTANVMDKLLEYCPESILELTIRNETAFHLAVKNNQVEAFKTLLEWLQIIHSEGTSLKSIYSKRLRVMAGRIKLLDKDDFGLKNSLVEDLQKVKGTLKKIKKEEVLNWKDDEGNTVLHLATFSQQCQMIKKMIGQNSINGPTVEVNEKNGIGQTALDIFLQLPTDEERDEMENILRQAGAMSAHEIINLLPQSSSPKAPMRNKLMEELQMFYFTYIWRDYLGFHVNKVSLSEARNSLLVVAVLIMAVTFQTGISPPGGIWQDNSNSNITNNSTSDPEILPHGAAGTAILAILQPRTYLLIVFFNMVGLFFSFQVIFLLTAGFPLRSHLNIALVSMVITSSLSTFAITPNEQVGVVKVIFLGTLLLSVLFNLCLSYRVRTSIR